jgi:Flp pilus assembly pilin Flp
MWISIGKQNNMGQNLIEYAVVLGVVTVALMGMQTYFKRSVQSVVKVVADAYSDNNQREPIGAVEMRIRNEAHQRPGKPLIATSISSGSMDQKQENVGESNIHTEISGTTTATTNSRTIVGDFRNRELN